MAHILDLPEEILLLIFRFYLETESQLRFLKDIAGVCDEWANLCKDCLLWRKFDGTLSQQVLLQFCQEGRLMKTEELIYSFSRNLDRAKCLKVFSGLPSLKSINFSNVRRIEENIFTSLAEHCTNVCEIKLSDSLHFPQYKVSEGLLYKFLTLCGTNLKVIDLSYTHIMGLKQLLCSVAQVCANLEQLLIRGIQYTGQALFPLEDIQRGCPKLRVLRLGLPICFTRPRRDSLPGFRLLEIFTHPSLEDISFADEDLINILWNSPNLKVLDIKGCRFLSVNALVSLPATHLENLYFSMTKRHVTERTIEILMKWSKSLRVVDVSGAKCDCIKKLLLDATSCGKMNNLECLDLSDTTVSIITVIKLIKNCKKLKYLNLSSCHLMGPGRMREYRGRSELEKLVRNLLSNPECR